MYDLTGFQRDLRYVIAGVDEPDGPGTNEELGSDHDGEVHHGRRYPNLDTPVQKGFVGKGSKDRRTNVYRRSRPSAAGLAPEGEAVRL